MELRAVEYFLAVAEHGSLRAAAQSLGVTQPALTKAIRRIEDETGARLFDRTARGVHPTVYGEAMLRHARNLRVSLRASKVEIAALKSGSAGMVRLGAGPSWERAILPDAIVMFRARRPNVRIQIHGGVDDVLKLRLRDGELDFVLAATQDAPALDPDLDWRTLVTDKYCVIAGRNHPLRASRHIELEKLLAYPWVLPGEHSLMVERLRTVYRAHALPPPDTMVETDIVALRHRLLLSGHYLSFTAARYLAELADRSIVRLDVPDAVWWRSAGVITRRGIEPSPAAAELIGMIAAVAGDAATQAGELSVTPAARYTPSLPRAQQTREKRP